jgi:transposase
MRETRRPRDPRSSRRLRPVATRSRTPPHAGAASEASRVRRRLEGLDRASLPQVPRAPDDRVRQDRIDAGERPGTPSAESARVRELEREIRELKRARFEGVRCSSRITLVVDHALGAPSGLAVAVGGRRQAQHPADRLVAKSDHDASRCTRSRRPALVELLRELMPTSRSHSRGAARSVRAATGGSSNAPPWSARQTETPGRAPHGARGGAASPPATRGRHRHARSAGHSQAPPAPRARSALLGTSLDVPPRGSLSQGWNPRSRASARNPGRVKVVFLE